MKKIVRLPFELNHENNAAKFGALYFQMDDKTVYYEMEIYGFDGEIEQRVELQHSGSLAELNIAAKEQEIQQSFPDWKYSQIGIQFQ